VAVVVSTILNALFLLGSWRYSQLRLGAGETPLPVLFLVHGSSLSGRSTFDIEAPGIGDYSMMNAFADFGFDVWTMDFEGYGRSGRTNGNSNIAEGVKDLDAATNVVMKETGQPRPHLFGESSGGLRVGAFAMFHPDRVGRLVLRFPAQAAFARRHALRLGQIASARAHVCIEGQGDSQRADESQEKHSSSL